MTSPSTAGPDGGPPPSAAELRAAFDAPVAMSVGVEEEVMVLDPESLDLAPRAGEILDTLRDDHRFKPELPASQLEIITPPRRGASEIADDLRTARSDLVAAAAGAARFAVAGVHPFAAAEGELNRGPRYDRTAAEHAVVARRQLVCALQVHVAVGGADRSLAVYNSLRSQLPLLAALAAHAPFHAGLDTGLASIRPAISATLPRQGVPPPIESWDAFAQALAWGARAERLPEPGLWWWELRPHPAHGTLEVRVPDGQASVEDAAAIVAVAHALVAMLAARHDAEGLPGPDPTWRIEENRWSAARWGVEGSMADLRSGERRETRELLGDLLDQLSPVAAEQGAAAALGHARGLVTVNGALRMRADAGPEPDLLAATRALAEQF